MSSTIMQAAVLKRYGAPENIEITSVPRPIPRAGELLVQVCATPVTTADTMMRRADPALARLFLGLRRPRRNIMGTGFAGRVVSVGAEVRDFVVGDRVFGNSGVNFSANAEYLCVAATGVVLPVPPELSYEEAATLCDGPVTSLHFLKTLGRLRAGQSVLIIGASGSLGTAAVQLARQLGGRVTGVCSTRNVDLVRSLGAAEVFDYTQTDFLATTERYDLIFDTIRVTTFAASRHLLKEQGAYLSPVLKLSLLYQMLKTRFRSGQTAKFDATGLRPPTELRAYLREVLELIEDNRLRIVMDKYYTLSETAVAHRYVDRGRKRGNVVLQL